MKKYMILLVIIFILFVPTVISATDYYLPTLAVLSFENHSGVKALNLENMGLQFLENALANSGMFTLIDRLTIKKTLEEYDFNIASGLVDPSYAVQLGKMLGARYLATGNISDINERVIEFKGYNIYTKRTIISVTIGLRIIDQKTGTILFTDQDISIQELPIDTMNLNTSGASNAIYQNLMKQAILKLVNSLREKTISIRPEIPEITKKILVPINSEPIGADVEVNGIFYGNTPCELSLDEGKILEIIISLGGYDSWIKKIAVSSALKINAKLNKSIPPAESSDLNVNIGITPSGD